MDGSYAGFIYLYDERESMDYDMTIFESASARNRNPSDTGRFDDSFMKLGSVGIRIRRVMCSSVEDIDTDGEAEELVSENGLDILPICEYQGVVICSGEYPSDQDLADFLSPPDGTIGADSQKPPSMGNDIMPSCNCGQRR